MSGPAYETSGSPFGSRLTRKPPPFVRSIAKVVLAFVIGMSIAYLFGAFVTLSWTEPVSDRAGRALLAWIGLSTAVLTSIQLRWRNL